MQPQSAFNQLNKMEFRPLEGFVFKVSPFNFSSRASNLNKVPVMMGNTIDWKPATTSLLSDSYLTKVFGDDALPDHLPRGKMIKQATNSTLSAGLARVPLGNIFACN